MTQQPTSDSNPLPEPRRISYLDSQAMPYQIRRLRRRSRLSPAREREIHAQEIRDYIAHLGAKANREPQPMFTASAASNHASSQEVDETNVMGGAEEAVVSPRISPDYSDNDEKDTDDNASAPGSVDVAAPSYEEGQNEIISPRSSPEHSDDTDDDSNYDTETSEQDENDETNNSDEYEDEDDDSEWLGSAAI